MIDVLFYYGTELLFVRIENSTLRFSTSLQASIWAPIEGIQLDYTGVCREFPDLEAKPSWKQEAIKRFKSKLKDLNTEEEVFKYIVKDLQKFGYIAKKKMKPGFRVEVIN